jgi:hypothetical protein
MSCDNCSCAECVPSLEEFGYQYSMEDVTGQKVHPQDWFSSGAYEKRTRYYRDHGYKKVCEMYKPEDQIPNVQDPRLQLLGQQLFGYLTTDLTYSWDVAADISSDVINFLSIQIKRDDEAEESIPEVKSLASSKYSDLFEDGM